VDPRAGGRTVRPVGQGLAWAASERLYRGGETAPGWEAAGSLFVSWSGDGERRKRFDTGLGEGWRSRTWSLLSRSLPK